MKTSTLNTPNRAATTTTQTSTVGTQQRLPQASPGAGSQSLTFQSDSFVSAGQERFTGSFDQSLNSFTSSPNKSLFPQSGVDAEKLQGLMDNFQQRQQLQDLNIKNNPVQENMRPEININDISGEQMAADIKDMAMSQAGLSPVHVLIGVGAGLLAREVIDIADGMLTSHEDLDEDGIPNHMDSDDDGDYLDQTTGETNPDCDTNTWRNEKTGDYCGTDENDKDDDNDGVKDTADGDPLDPSESITAETDVNMLIDGQNPVEENLLRDIQSQVGLEQTNQLEIALETVPAQYTNYQMQTQTAAYRG